MKVIATTAAFFAGRRVRPGQEVDVPEGTKATWFVKAKAKASAQEPKGAAQEPMTLSQAGKDTSKTFVDVVGKKDADIA